MRPPGSAAPRQDTSSSSRSVGVTPPVCSIWSSLSRSPAAATFSSRCADAAGAGDDQHVLTERQRPRQPDLRGAWRPSRPPPRARSAAPRAGAPCRLRPATVKNGTNAIPSSPQRRSSARSSDESTENRFWTQTTSVTARAASSWSRRDPRDADVADQSLRRRARPGRRRTARCRGPCRCGSSRRRAGRGRAGAGSPRHGREARPGRAGRPTRPCTSRTGPDLGHDGEVVGVRRQGSVDQLVGRAGRAEVERRGVDVVDAELDGPPQHRDRRVAIARHTVVERPASR